MRVTSLGRSLFALALAASSGCGGDADVGARRAELGCAGCTVLVGGTVFDGTRAGRGVVVIEGDHVKQVVLGEARAAAGEVVDVTGKTVLPGLLDMHVHLMADAVPLGAAVLSDHAEDHLKAMLRAGVTSTLDLGSSAHVVFEYRRRVAEGRILGPRLFAAGPLLTPTGGHPCYAGSPPGDSCVFVDSPEDVDRALATLAPDKPDLVKIVVEAGAAKPIPRMTEPSMAALERAAEAKGLRLIAHVSAPADVEDALTAGIGLFAHIPSADVMSPDLVRRMAAAGAVVVPTLAVIDAFDRLAHGEGVDAAALRDDVPAEVVAALRDPAKLGAMASPSYAAMTSRWRKNAFDNLAACRSAGVTIAAGTDAGNPGTFHGLAVARELGLYVEAGLSPLEALTAATKTAADVLGRPDLGRLEPGAAADVVVVDGDALHDIGALGRVARVYRAGALVDRGALALPRKTSLTKAPTTGLGAGETCLHASECGPGLACDIDQVCVPACDHGGGCAPGSACLSLDGSPLGGACFPGDGCDPVAQSCPNAAACVPLGNGATWCAFAGAGSDGQPCGGDGSCARGSACSFDSNTCLDLCDPSGSGEGCASGKACVDASSWAGVDVGVCR